MIEHLNPLNRENILLKLTLYVRKYPPSRNRGLTTHTLEVTKLVHEAVTCCSCHHVPISMNNRLCVPVVPGQAD